MLFGNTELPSLTFELSNEQDVYENDAGKFNVKLFAQYLSENYNCSF